MRFLLIINLFLSGQVLFAQLPEATLKPVPEGWYQERSLEKLIPAAYHDDQSLRSRYEQLQEVAVTGTNAAHCEALKEIGRRYDALFAYDSALIFFERSAALARKHNDYFSLALALLNEGVAHKRQGRYATALNALDKAVLSFELCDSLHLSDRFFYSAYNTMGNCNNELSNHTRALECILQAKAFAERLDDNINKLGIVYNNLGITHAALEDYQPALDNYRASLHYKLEEGDTLAFCNTLYNIGNLFYKQEQVDSALYFWEESMQGALERNAALYTLNPAIKLANHHVAVDKLSEALSFLQIAEEQVDEVTNLDVLSEFHRMKAGYLSAIGKHEEANKSLSRYIELYDKHIDAEMNKLVLDLHQAYDSERKKEQINDLNTQNALQELALRQNRIIIWVTVIGIVVLAVLAWILYSRYKIRKESEEKIKMLMRELHHRVKNNLQILSDLLSLQSSRIVDANAREAVKAGEDRVKAMALIHKDVYMSEELQDIDMSNYIWKLVRNLMTSYGYSEKQLTLQLEADPLHLDVDKAIPLGLIINELVSNAFKYAFLNHESPVLLVTLKRAGAQEAILTVSDNGEGIRPGQELNKNSFGLKLVEMLTRQLQGKMEKQTTPGMTYQLQFKTRSNKKQ